MKEGSELQSRQFNNVNPSNEILPFNPHSGSQHENTSQEEYHENPFIRPLSVKSSSEEDNQVGPTNSNGNDPTRQTSSFRLTSVLPTKDMERRIVSDAAHNVLPVPTELSELSKFGKHDSSSKEEDARQCPSFDYVGHLVVLAAFGILGVLTRYLLRKLFGPTVANVTNDHSFLYLDLPSNIVGSFLMGWFGIVFKSDLSHYSNHLAIGLSTGYLGSLTTFSSWNQAMINLSVNDKWVYAVLGFVIGLFLAAISIILGVWTAERFRWVLRNNGMGSDNAVGRIYNPKHHLIIPLAFLTLGGLWITSGVLELKEFKNGGDGAKLWLACLVGPTGVWVRWWLARFNGRGLGRSIWFKWVPFGTLTANTLAACIMAALATVKKQVNTKNWDTITTGIQIGLPGCLSTVSTFMAELHDMTQTTRWRACVYTIMTIGISFVLGTLIYSLPNWI